jgi:hypothetical protein
MKLVEYPEEAAMPKLKLSDEKKKQLQDKLNRKSE